MFLDGPGSKTRDAVHILFAGEKVREDDLAATPNMSEAEEDEAFRIVSLEALIRMKLTSFRDKDRTHLRDMIDLSLVDATWPSRYPSELACRLQRLLDDPDG